MRHIIVFLLPFLLLGCSTPEIPPEVSLTSSQEHDLWRFGASTYTPDEYRAYLSSLDQAKQRLLKENARFAWFRDYEMVQQEYAVVLHQGDQLRQEIFRRKHVESSKISDRLSYLKNRSEVIRKLSTLINEGRVARKAITRADLLIAEGESLFKSEQYSDSEDRLTRASSDIDSAIKIILPILNRYADEGQIVKWREWVRETIDQSLRAKQYAIIVSKIDRILILYKNGVPYKTYKTGLGINGSKDKIYAGDRATPEGRYQITRKKPNSRFHKALLINYPNSDDRKQFALLKKKGLIPATAGIGGLIEIHGGGNRGMTYGCIALENAKIDELFSIVPVGTSVTIVGAMDFDNSIALTMKELT